MSRMLTTDHTRASKRFFDYDYDFDYDHDDRP